MPSSFAGTEDLPESSTDDTATALFGSVPLASAALGETGDTVLPPDNPAITGDEASIRVSEPSTLNEPGAEKATLSGWQFESARPDDQFLVSASVADPAVGSLSDFGGQSTTAANASIGFTGSLTQVNDWLDGVVFQAADVERGLASGQTKVVLSITNITDAQPVAVDHEIEVEVASSNDPVTIADATRIVAEGANNTVITKDTLAAVDPETEFGAGNPTQIIYTLSKAPNQGYLQLNGTRIGADSVFSHQQVLDGQLVYVHTATGAEQNKSDAFQVRVNDGATPLDKSDTATITLDIAPVNQAPVITNSSGTVYEGQPQNAKNGAGAAASAASAVGNFISATGGGDPGDTTLNVTLTSLPSNGTLYFNGVEVTQADIDSGFSFAYADRGSLTYGHDGSGDPNPPKDAFGFTVTDGGGGAAKARP